MKVRSETGLAAAEIALLWLQLTGNPGGWTVTDVAAGHSGENSFGARLAVAVAERRSLGYLQVWRDRPIKGVSHPNGSPASAFSRLIARIALTRSCAENRLTVR